jgi:hypothetical protein
MVKRVSDQSKRFIEAAREAETDDSPETFERIFAKVVPPKKAGVIARKTTEDPRAK